jgi:alpha-tubulin suppressor-like RCC1 family protein
MNKVAVCLLALAACGLPDKNRCTTSSDCLGDEACIDMVCQSASNDACGPARTRCAPEASCTGTSAGLACTCNAGYAGDGQSCADVDECAAATSPCAPHASCANTTGSFSCTCSAGYAGDGRTYCVPGTFTKIAPANSFTCALGEDHGIYCWGGNALGELGDGTTVPHAHPALVGAATDWIDVAAGTHVACGIKADHSMWCWGFGSNGELGDGRAMTEYVPTQVISDKPGVGWKAVSIGLHHLCGLHDDGSLACWGRDVVANANVSAPLAVDSNTDWTAVTVGRVRCGLRGAPGTVYCWGRSFSGELGLGTTKIQATPAQVGGDTWKRIEAGGANVCGIRSDGALLCWGNNSFNNTALHYGDTPLQVGTATDWQAVSLSSWSIVGLRAGGLAYRWGLSLDASHLPADQGEIQQPTLITESPGAWSELKCANVHTCGIVAGQAYCAGDIVDGLLGDGTTTTRMTPTKIGTDHWTALAGSQGQCGLRDDGALMCWGESPDLGVGFGNGDPVWSPARLGTDSWSAVSGSNSTFPSSAMCAIRDGQIYCWGDNSSGELGTGNTDSPQRSPVPVNTANVPAATQWTEVAVGDHTCAITSTGALWCWGANDSGQLGTGTASEIPTPAPSVALSGTWLHVAVTNYDYQTAMTCGIKSDHTLWCWGKDQPPTMTQHLVPTQVGSESSWASVAIGPTFTATATAASICAVKLDGTLWCWGIWIGDGTANSSTVPVQVGADSDWRSVSVGSEICATKTGGTLWCWGNAGLLGNGQPLALDAAELPVRATRPTQIGKDADWSAAQTNNVSCATRTDGSLWCWGFGAASIPAYSITPVKVD